MSRSSPEGRLSVSTPVGLLEEDTPYVYQEAGDERVAIEAAYSLEEDEPSGTYRFGFRIGPYDLEKPLFVDPLVLTHCGYIGEPGRRAGIQHRRRWIRQRLCSGNNDLYRGDVPCRRGTRPHVQRWDSRRLRGQGECGRHSADSTPVISEARAARILKSIAVDASGNAYVSGFTDSTEATFPVSIGPDLTYNGGALDAFVVKVNAAGTALVYAGYIGGSGDEEGYDVAVDGSGNAYVSGYTGSNQATFPVAVGPDLTKNGAGLDGYVAKVNASGTALVYCGYIGGTGLDEAFANTVDASGNLYVAGNTASTRRASLTRSVPDMTFNGGASDAFVAKVNAAGTALDFAGYIGGREPIAPRAWPWTARETSTSPARRPRPRRPFPRPGART